MLGVAAGATASIARGGKFSIQQVAVDAFGNALGESIVDAFKQDGTQNLSERAGNIQAAQKNLARLAEQYGGMDNVPMNLPEVQDALRIGRGNLATVEALTTDKALAAQIGRGAAARANSSASASVEDVPIVDSPVADGSESPIVLPRVEVSGGSALQTAARFAATAGGVVTGVFQSIGDGVIGAATLLNDALGAQRYMMLQTLSADLNQATWGYEDRKKSFDTMVAIGQGVGRIVDDPGSFIANAASHTFDDILSSLNTAEATDNLSDWFFYGAKVGHAAMDIAGLIGGVAALPKMAVGVAGIAVNGARTVVKGARTVAQALAPKVGAMAGNYMEKMGLTPSIVAGSGGASSKLGGVGTVAEIGVPATRSANPLSPVRDFDAFGNEITYRTMSPGQAKQFELTGQLPPTTETSTAAALEYASGKYTERGGITYRLTTRPGTSAQLQEIGIAAPGDARVVFPEMSTQNGPWMQTNARFKVEGGQMTTQLGQGRAIDIFNENLIDFFALPKRGP